MAAPVLAPLFLLLWPMTAPQMPPRDLPQATLVNGDAVMPDTLTGRWIVTEVAEAVILPGIPVALEFGATGGIAGKSGCNSFSASLKVSGHDLSPGPVRSTKMACDSDVMALEAAFHRALDRLTRYDIEGDGTLVLYGFETVMMRARRE